MVQIVVLGNASSGRRVRRGQLAAGGVVGQQQPFPPQNVLAPPPAAAMAPGLVSNGPQKAVDPDRMAKILESYRSAMRLIHMCLVAHEQRGEYKGEDMFLASHDYLKYFMNLEGYLDYPLISGRLGAPYRGTLEEQRRQFVAQLQAHLDGQRFIRAAAEVADAMTLSSTDISKDKKNELVRGIDNVRKSLEELKNGANLVAERSASDLNRLLAVPFQAMSQLRQYTEQVIENSGEMKENMIPVETVRDIVTGFNAQIIGPLLESIDKARKKAADKPKQWGLVEDDMAWNIIRKEAREFAAGNNGVPKPGDDGKTDLRIAQKALTELRTIMSLCTTLLHGAQFRKQRLPPDAKMQETKLGHLDFKYLLTELTSLINNAKTSVNWRFKLRNVPSNLAWVTFDDAEINKVADFQKYLETLRTELQNKPVEYLAYTALELMDKAITGTSIQATEAATRALQPYTTAFEKLETTVKNLDVDVKRVARTSALRFRNGVILRVLAVPALFFDTITKWTATLTADAVVPQIVLMDQVNTATMTALTHWREHMAKDFDSKLNTVEGDTLWGTITDTIQWKADMENATQKLFQPAINTLQTISNDRVAMQSVYANVRLLEQLLPITRVEGGPRYLPSVEFKQAAQELTRVTEMITARVKAIAPAAKALHDLVRGPQESKAPPTLTFIETNLSSTSNALDQFVVENMRIYAKAVQTKQVPYEAKDGNHLVNLSQYVIRVLEHDVKDTKYDIFETLIEYRNRYLRLRAILLSLHNLLAVYAEEEKTEREIATETTHAAIEDARQILRTYGARPDSDMDIDAATRWDKFKGMLWENTARAKAVQMNILLDDAESAAKLIEQAATENKIEAPMRFLQDLVAIAFEQENKDNGAAGQVSHPTVVHNAWNARMRTVMTKVNELRKQLTTHENNLISGVNEISERWARLFPQALLDDFITGWGVVYSKLSTLAAARPGGLEADPVFEPVQQFSDDLTKTLETYTTKVQQVIATFEDNNNMAPSDEKRRERSLNEATRALLRSQSTVDLVANVSKIIRDWRTKKGDLSKQVSNRFHELLEVQVALDRVLPSAHAMRFNWIPDGDMLVVPFADKHGLYAMVTSHMARAVEELQKAIVRSSTEAQDIVRKWNPVMGSMVSIVPDGVRRLDMSLTQLSHETAQMEVYYKALEKTIESVGHKVKAQFTEPLSLSTLGFTVSIEQQMQRLRTLAQASVDLSNAKIAEAKYKFDIGRSKLMYEGEEGARPLSNTAMLQLLYAQVVHGAVPSNNRELEKLLRKAQDRLNRFLAFIDKVVGFASTSTHNILNTSLFLRGLSMDPNDPHVKDAEDLGPLSIDRVVTALMRAAAIPNPSNVKMRVLSDASPSAPRIPVQRQGGTDGPSTLAEAKLEATEDIDEKMRLEAFDLLTPEQRREHFARITPGNFERPAANVVDAMDDTLPMEEEQPVRPNANIRAPGPPLRTRLQQEDANRSMNETKVAPEQPSRARAQQRRPQLQLPPAAVAAARRPPPVNATLPMETDEDDAKQEFVPGKSLVSSWHDIASSLHNIFRFKHEVITNEYFPLHSTILSAATNGQIGPTIELTENMAKALLSGAHRSGVSDIPDSVMVSFMRRIDQYARAALETAREHDAENRAPETTAMPPVQPAPDINRLVPIAEESPAVLAASDLTKPQVMSVTNMITSVRGLLFAAQTSLMKAETFAQGMRQLLTPMGSALIEKAWVFLQQSSKTFRRRSLAQMILCSGDRLNLYFAEFAANFFQDKDGQKPTRYAKDGLFFDKLTTEQNDMAIYILENVSLNENVKSARDLDHGDPWVFGGSDYPILKT